MAAWANARNAPKPTQLRIGGRILTRCVHMTDPEVTGSRKATMQNIEIDFQNDNTQRKRWRMELDTERWLRFLVSYVVKKRKRTIPTTITRFQ
jgi:hypothetical protein